MSENIERMAMTEWPKPMQEIQRIMWLVEECGASEKLTEVIVRLGKLKDKYPVPVESVPAPRDRRAEWTNLDEPSLRAQLAAERERADLLKRSYDRLEGSYYALMAEANITTARAEKAEAQLAAERERADVLGDHYEEERND